MLKRALAYRLGSVLIGFGLNYLIFGSLVFSAFLTILFTVVLTAYYMAFHALWKEKPPISRFPPNTDMRTIDI